MKRMTTVTVWTGTVAIAVMSAACSDRTDRAAATAARDTGTAAARVGDAAKEAGRDVAEAAKGATRTASEALDKGARAAEAAVETMDVKMALVADSRVDASGINVDTDHLTKTVTLKGHVPTAAQKAIAGQIAVLKAEGYQVRNELTVGQ